MVVVKPRSHCPGFQSRCRYGVSWLSGPPGPHRSDVGKHRIESGHTVLNRRSPGSGSGGFNFLNNLHSPGLTRLRINAGLFLGITVALPA